MKRTTRLIPAGLSRWGGMALALMTAASTCLQAADPAPDAVAEEKSPWEASAALGFTLTRGNSETLLANLNVVGTRKKDHNELLLGLDGTYGEDKGTKNNEQLRGHAQYNRTFGYQDRWFGYARLDALHDAIADVEGRFGLNAGLGYYLIKSKKMSLSVEAGPGVITEKKGTSNWDTYMTVRAADRFDYNINERTKLWQTAEFLPQVDEMSDYLINAELGISTAITPKWDLRLVLQDNYRSKPATGRKQNDLKLIAGIGFKFL